VKIILSRKGFDSSSGGVANPILPDGRLQVLPIPDAAAPHAYAEIQRPGGNLGELVEDLTRRRLTRENRAHLDPDLDRAALPRPRPWRPLFGQMGAAQGHLRAQGVGVGDIFLFFGWFREVALGADGYHFQRDSADRHIFHGWLQIGEMIELSKHMPRKNSWLRDHPHCYGERGGNNVLYVASRQLSFSGLSRRLPGAGVFPRFHDALVLTWPGERRAIWRLPDWFHPQGRASQLSYHATAKRWQPTPQGLRLDSAKRGQEFVLNGAHYPEANAWLADLLETGLKT